MRTTMTWHTALAIAATVSPCALSPATSGGLLLPGSSSTFSDRTLVADDQIRIDGDLQPAHPNLLEQKGVG